MPSLLADLGLKGLSGNLFGCSLFLCLKGCFCCLLGRQTGNLGSLHCSFRSFCSRQFSGSGLGHGSLLLIRNHLFQLLNLERQFRSFLNSDLPGYGLFSRFPGRFLNGFFSDFLRRLLGCLFGRFLRCLVGSLLSRFFNRGFGS
ncbi:hypothetical protein N9Z79_03315 [Akkermansiaceae bacterium]|nr:hypothetical protein [Akkermansiaceae bacterium]